MSSAFFHRIPAKLLQHDGWSECFLCILYFVRLPSPNPWSVVTVRMYDYCDGRMYSSLADGRFTRRPTVNCGRGRTSRCREISWPPKYSDLRSLRIAVIVELKPILQEQKTVWNWRISWINRKCDSDLLDDGEETSSHEQRRKTITRNWGWVIRRNKHGTCLPAMKWLIDWSTKWINAGRRDMCRRLDNERRSERCVMWWFGLCWVRFVIIIIIIIIRIFIWRD